MDRDTFVKLMHRELYTTTTIISHLEPLHREIVIWNCAASRTLPTHHEGTCRLPFQPTILLQYGQDKDPDSPDWDKFSYSTIVEAFERAKLSKLMLYCCICTWTPRKVRQVMISRSDLEIPV